MENSNAFYLNFINSSGSMRRKSGASSRPLFCIKTLYLGEESSEMFSVEFVENLQGKLHGKS